MLEKGPDAIFPRGLIGFAAQRLTDLDLGEQTGAARGKRSPHRLVQHKGDCGRDWPTRVGTVEGVGPQSPARIPLPRLAGAAPDDREGADRDDPGSPMSRAS